MTSTTWVVIAIAVIVIALAAFMILKKRTERLKAKFGPEYDRAVRRQGSAFNAERELEQRAKRVEKFHIRGLSRDECDRFERDWRVTQERFVDDPRGAVAEADKLVDRAMKTRGYPIGGEFDERVADISVDHPRVVENYRAAHQIAAPDARQAASTEDLRVAMKHYRALFQDLLGHHVDELKGARK